MKSEVNLPVQGGKVKCHSAEFQVRSYINVENLTNHHKFTTEKTMDSDT